MILDRPGKREAFWTLPEFKQPKQSEPLGILLGESNFAGGGEEWRLFSKRRGLHFDELFAAVLIEGKDVKTQAVALRPGHMFHFRGQTILTSLGKAMSLKPKHQLFPRQTQRRVLCLPRSVVTTHRNSGPLAIRLLEFSNSRRKLGREFRPGNFESAEVKVLRNRCRSFRGGERVAVNFRVGPNPRFHFGGKLALVVRRRFVTRNLKVSKVAEDRADVSVFELDRHLSSPFELGQKGPPME